ncbi:MAG: hydrogenase maturation protease [Chloroflexota bacterium]
MRRLFVGIGNPLRGDDAAGLLAARALRARAPQGIEVRELEGEPVGLIEAWDGAEAVVVADAVASGGEPGEVHRVDAAAGPLPAALAGASTHAMGLAEAVELARALDRLPSRLVVYGIEAASFETGTEPSAAVRAAAERVAEAVAADLNPSG